MSKLTKEQKELLKGIERCYNCKKIVKRDFNFYLENFDKEYKCPNCDADIGRRTIGFYLGFNGKKEFLGGVEFEKPIEKLDGDDFHNLVSCLEISIWKKQNSN